MKDLIERTEAYGVDKGLFREGESIVAAVSGGPDSVCLLYILCALREKWHFTLSALHVNHGLREEAGEDEAFTKELCASWNVSFRSVFVNVKEEAEKRGVSLEEAGRIARQNAYEEAAEDADAVALAHHAGDQAETILWNILRGSGVLGLSGMAAKEGFLIRPLLFAEREEIESFLEKEGISWRVDRTNAENDFTRNRIRNQILPQIENTVNSGAAKHLVSLGEDARVLRSLIERLSKEAAARCVREEEGSVRLFCAPLLSEDEAIRPQVVLLALEMLYGRRRDITRVHIEIVLRLCDAAAGKRISLPAGCEAVREADGIRLYRTEEFPQNEPTPPGTEFPFSEVFSVQLFSVGEDGDRRAYMAEKEYTKCFDYAIIKGALCARTKRPGDRITVNAQGGTQSLKELFINAKIPRMQRQEVMLLADEEEVLWVCGCRISEKYKVTTETKAVLMVTLNEAYRCRTANGMEIGRSS